MLVVEGEVKLLDFGIAAPATGTAELAGTLEYMAPELLLGKPPSAASDLYSVGVLFYQMLAGHFPYSQDSMTRMLEGILGRHPSDYTFAPTVADLLENYRSARRSQPQVGSTTDPQEATIEQGEEPKVELQFPTDVPVGVMELVRRLLARDAEDRHRDATEALQELAAAVDFALPVETAATRESFLRATELLGRETELADLMALLRRAQTGHGATALVGGESGVGKSRLISELRTQALVNVLWVVEGQSVSEGGGYYQELLPLLRALCFRVDILDAEASVLKPLLPELTELLARPINDPVQVNPQETLARLAATLLGLLAKVRKPLIVILEDLHWARGETLALLSAVTPKLERLPVLVVGTFRSDERPELPKQLPAALSMSLSRFGADAIQQLSASMLGAVGATPALVRYLEQQTEGNVFFLIEVVRALAENAGQLRRIRAGELPQSVLTTGIERIVERRIDRVRESCGALLEFAATQGRKLDLAVLARAFPDTVMRTFLMQCANAAVLESQGNDWRFSHDKLREALLRRIDKEALKQLHRRVGEAIEMVYGGGEREAMSAVLAHHFRQAGVIDRALHYYLQAGDSAAKLYLYEDAREHYAAALATATQLPDTPERQRAHVDILLKQVQVGLTNDKSEVLSRRLTEARTLLDGLAPTGSAVPEDRLRMARVDYGCGRVAHVGGKPREAIFYYQRVLPVAKEFADEELMLLPASVIGQALGIQGHFSKALEMIKPTIEPMLRQFGINGESLRCVGFHSIILAGVGQCRQSLAELDRLHGWSKQKDQLFYQGIFLSIQDIVLLLHSDWPMALKSGEQLQELAKRTDELLYLYGALDTMAWAQSHLGRHSEALANRAQAVQLRHKVGGGMAADWFDAAEAEILLCADRPEEALRQAQKVAASSRAAGCTFSGAIAERAWGVALGRLSGEPAEVESHFVQSLEMCRAGQQVMNAAQTELWWGRSCRERGDEVAAQLHFSRALTSLAAAGAQYALDDAKRIAAGDTGGATG